jgi:hypothetical protein
LTLHWQNLLKRFGYVKAAPKGWPRQGLHLTLVMVGADSDAAPQQRALSVPHAIQPSGKALKYE